MGYAAWYTSYARAATAQWRGMAPPLYPAYQTPPYLPSYPQYGQPPQQPQWQWGQGPYGAPAWSPESPVEVSLANVGMVLFMCAAGLLLVVNLLMMVLM